MANSWLRLWHDMPTDPKWRTIARASGQSISTVQAIYVHLLVDASRNVTRGHATVTHEDLASALDVTEDVITAILSAMQGRVLDGMYLLGWDKRQPKREDSGDENTGAKSAAQRQAEKRERDRIAAEQDAENPEKPQRHDASRNVTLDKDKDKDKEKIHTQPDGFDDFWKTYPKKTAKPAAARAFKAAKINGHLPEVMAHLEAMIVSADWQKNGGQFIPNPATYLNNRRWEDGAAQKETLRFV